MTKSNIKEDSDLRDSDIDRIETRRRREIRTQNHPNAAWIVITIVALVGLAVVVGWSYIAMRQQADDIRFLNSEIAGSVDEQKALNEKIAENAQKAATLVSDNAQLANANKQIQLYKDFLVMTADVKQEVKDLQSYNISNPNAYQFCVNYMERSNNINHAMSRFAEKEIIYYQQIAILADKQECNAKINLLNQVMEKSKIADESLYQQEMKECARLQTNPISGNLKLENDLLNARNEANAQDKAFTIAEKEVIACFK